MAKEAPNSFRDPYWSDLAGTVEAKLDLPKGLLASIVTNGERSNADQVSEAGAKTPFQIIPATRKAAIDKYGIDPMLSPENAAEVAGLLLKDSLDRNKGDASLAVAEYHGGTDRANWGPKTKAYVQRVTGGLPTATTDLPTAATDSTGKPQSTFDRVSAQMAKPAPSAMAGTLAAYKNGQMDPADAAKFEAQVKAGNVLLPNGITLNDAPQASAQSGAPALPPALLDAYNSGRMTPEDRAKIDAQVKAGMVSGDGLSVVGANSKTAIPGNLPGDANYVENGHIAQPKPEDSLAAKLASPLDAALTMGSGALAAIPGAAIEAVQGPEAGRAFMQQYTRQPQTQTGASIVESVVDAAHELGMEALPGIGGELAVLGRAAAPVTQAVTDAGRSAAVPVAATLRTAQGAIGSSATKVAEAVKSVLPGAEAPAARPTPGTLGSVGSAGADMATQRQMMANELPVPIKLTKGQAERGFEQQRFEQETAKDPHAGQPLRERYADQNDAILKNFDAWMDQTGAEAPSLRAVGASVDKALVEQSKRDKTAYRVAYKEAEKAGELSEPADLSGVVAHLNESAPDAATAPLLNVARARALQLGVATEDATGALVAQPVSLKAAETFRQAINRATDYEATNVRQATIIKGLVDEATDGLGGNLYQKARALRTRYAQNYENRAGISKLLDTKRGTADRQIALEDVFDHTMLKSSLDDVRNTRRVLQRAGPEGEQAWRELQGSTMNWLKMEATKNVATDIRGNQIVSAAGLNKAVRTLDADGKLEYIFGKKGAQQIRDLNELSKVVYTAPPGAVNSSNTASVILAALTEMGATGALTGLPIPVLTGLKVIATRVKDRQLAARINEALGNAKGKTPAKAAPQAASQTVH